MQTGTDSELSSIPLEKIIEMIESAMQIPSAAGGQPTQFVVLYDIETLYRAAEIVPLSFHSMQALAAIVVCGDLIGAADKEKWMTDCGAALEHLHKAANSAGFAANKAPIFPDGEKIYGMTVMLGLPHHIIPHSYLALGYPVRISKSAEPSGPDRVHYNSW